MAITNTTLSSGISQLRSLLATTLAADLGQYDINGTKIPAIWVMPPDLPQSYSIVPKSGVELIINAQPTIFDGGTMGRRSHHFYFQLLMRQWDERKTLTVPVLKVRGVEGLDIHTDPVIRPYQEINGEKFYAQARMNVIATDIDLFK